MPSSHHSFSRFFFFFNDTATTEIYTLSLHDALPISLSEFPEDPFLNSYYGYLMATVEGKHQEGVKICQDALLRLKKYEHFGFEFLYPLFYLNLGRVYLSAGLKRNAVENFRRGLSFDPENQEILSELKGMGIRKGPAISILQRNNPLNKYLGLLLTRLKSGTSNP